MNKNLSTSSFDLNRFLIKTGVFIAVILVGNMVVLATILYTPKKEAGKETMTTAKVCVFGASNVGYDIDPDRLDHAQILSTSEPFGFFLAFERCLAECRARVLLLDMPYSWYTPEKYAPASYPFYSGITPQSYRKLIRKKPVLALKNFLSTNIFNTEVLLFWKNMLEAKGARILAATPAPSAKAKVPDAYHTCTGHYDPKKHFISQMTYSDEHLRYIRSEIMDYTQPRQMLVLAKYPELNKDNYRINPSLAQLISHNFEMINQMEAWPDSLMYDQWYHLNQCGKEANTKNIETALTMKGILPKTAGQPHL